MRVYQSLAPAHGILCGCHAAVTALPSAEDTEISNCLNSEQFSWLGVAGWLLLTPPVVSVTIVVTGDRRGFARSSLCSVET